MTQLLKGLARSAKRSQFRIVGDDATAPPQGPKRKKSAGAQARRRPADPLPGRKKNPAADPMWIPNLYCQTFHHLNQHIDAIEILDRDQFFYAMHFLKLLGLTTEEVTDELSYTKENVGRWMNGTRCPHVEMRRTILDRCVGILRDKVDTIPPREFIRAVDEA